MSVETRTGVRASRHDFVRSEVNRKASTPDLAMLSAGPFSVRPHRRVIRRREKGGRRGPAAKQSPSPARQPGALGLRAQGCCAILTHESAGCSTFAPRHELRRDRADRLYQRDPSDALIRLLCHWRTAGGSPAVPPRWRAVKQHRSRTTKETCNGNRFSWGIAVFN
jgi:hypothetical protein